MQECTGNLPVRAGWLLLVEKIARLLIPLYCNVTALVFTSIVTFGHQTWTTWYWALVQSAFYVCALVWVSSMGVGFKTASSPLLGLTHRMHLRAIKLTLGDLFSVLRDELDASSNGDHGVDHDAAKQAQLQFITMQTQLAAYSISFPPITPSGTTLGPWHLTSAQRSRTGTRAKFPAIELTKLVPTIPASGINEYIPFPPLLFPLTKHFRRRIRIRKWLLAGGGR
jgi:hypothetical protein